MGTRKEIPSGGAKHIIVSALCNLEIENNIFIFVWLHIRAKHVRGSGSDLTKLEGIGIEKTLPRLAMIEGLPHRRFLGSRVSDVNFNKSTSTIQLHSGEIHHSCIT